MTDALIIISALAFQWGYRTGDDGLIEYTIQLRPDEAEHLASSGEEVVSYIPAEAQPIGKIRIVVGGAPLERSSHITETQYRTNGRQSPDKDIAGRLVAVRPAAAAESTAPTPGGLQLTTPTGAALESDKAASAQTIGDVTGAGQDEVPAGQPLPREEFRKPVHVVNNAPEPPSSSPTLNNDNSVQATSEAGDSPSDLPSEEQARSRNDDSPEEDRPWLPLVAVAAVACGFLAGNVFQWRTYVSLRKRYLQLLRKTE